MLSASVEPTRPQPMITICTARPFKVVDGWQGACARPGDVMPSEQRRVRPRAAEADAWSTCRSPGHPRRKGNTVPRSASPRPSARAHAPAERPMPGPRWSASASRCGSGRRPGRLVRRAARGAGGVFVRHALPGERVVAQVTEGTAEFARADAVESCEASADRVDRAVPLRRAGPLRRLRLAARFARRPAGAEGGRDRGAAAALAGIERDVVVEPRRATSRGRGVPARR